MPNLNDNLIQAQNVLSGGASSALFQPQQISIDPLALLTTQAESKEEKEISLKTLKKSEIDKIMQAINKCKKIADNYYTGTVEPKIKEREEIYLASEAHYNKKYPILSESTKWRSRDVKTTIDWMLPSLVEVFTGSDDPVDIKGVNVEDDDTAKKIQQLIKYQLERKNSYFTFMLNELTAALKCNFAVAKIHWKRDEKRESYEMMLDINDIETLMRVIEQSTKGAIEITAFEALSDAEDLYKVTFDKVIVIANHPVIEYLPASEFRFTPEATNVQECKFVAHRKVVQGDYLKRKESEGIYENVNDALENAGNITPATADVIHNRELNNISNRLSDNDIASKQVELYECYMKIDYNNDGIFENVIVHCVGETPLRISKNEFDFAPFFTASAEYDPHVIFGSESFADSLEQLQDLKTALIRQVIINVAKNNAPQTFVNGKNVDLDALIAGEEYIDCDEPPASSVYIPPSLPLSNVTMQLVEYAQNEIESQSGSTRYNQGLDSNSLNKTATGITAIMGAADKRIKLLAKQLAENFVVPIMKFIILLNQKFAEPEQFIRLTNENVTIRKEDLEIDYDLIINVGQGAGTREAQIQYLMLLINQIYPQLQQQGIVTPSSWYSLVKELLEKMGIRNTANYLLDPNSEEAQQLKQQQAQAQQQAQQQELAILQAKAQLDLTKAQTPKISSRLEDLPLDVQQQLIQNNLGVQTTPQSMIGKEVLRRV